MTTKQQERLTNLLEAEMGENRNYGLSDDRPAQSYIDDFSMGEVAYGAYPPFDTNRDPVPYMDDLGISGIGELGDVLYHGVWEDENELDGMGIHGTREGITPVPIVETATDLIKPAIVPSSPAAMVANETEGRNRVLLWGGLAIAALMFLGPK